MAESVVFRGDPRKVAALAIEASVGVKPALDLITYPTWVSTWNMKQVRFMCRRHGDEPDTWIMLHGPRMPFTSRPWATKYPDASSIVKAAGLEIVTEKTYEEHFRP